MKDAGPGTVSHAFVRERFLGFNSVRADATLPGMPAAAFTGQQGPGECRALPGVPLLINTLTNEQASGGITLLLGTFKTYVVASSKPRPKGEGNLRITARVISLDRAQGGELLKRHATDGAACLAELKAMVGAETAVLEHVSTILTPSSMRAVHQSGSSHTYGVEFAEVPILFLSAKSEEIDVVVGRRLGADDFVRKPFGKHELIARIQSALRRGRRTRTTSPSFEMGPLRVFPAELRAMRDEAPAIDLTPREVSLLRLLHERAGQALGRDVILDMCWGLDYMPECRTLDRHIAKLRKKIERETEEIIETVRGVGYRWRAEQGLFPVYGYIKNRCRSERKLLFAPDQRAVML